MSSYQITTARSAFVKATADKRYPCAGMCGKAIEKRMTYFTKPFYRKGKVIGWTRLHNLDECWETYDQNATDTLILRRAVRNREYRQP